MPAGEVALYEREELVVQLALVLYRPRDELPFLFEGPGVYLVEGCIPPLYPAPDLPEFDPVFAVEVPVQLPEDTVFDLALALQQVQHPLQLEFLGALVLELALQVVHEHLLVPPFKGLIRFDGNLVQPRLGARALHPF